MTIKGASLVVVGSGIKFVSHLTVEAKVYIEQSDIVLFLVNEPAIKEWIIKMNPRSESLDYLYFKYSSRLDCYHAIAEYILITLRKIQHVCAVFYGHPSVLCEPGLQAVIQARKEGFYAKILPGISANACLYADLLIDPGSSGCQFFEATDFLIHRRKFDPSSHLILCQVDIIGVLNNPTTHDNRIGATILVEYLRQYYKLEHEVILYEAAQYPSFDPLIKKINLGDIPNSVFSRIMTLYIPPLENTSYDNTLFEQLKIK